MTRSRFFALAAAYTALVLGLLWMPSPGVSSGGVRVDLVAHVVLFSVLGLLWHRALAGRVGGVLLLGLALGLVTELVQGVLPWPRAFEPADLAADAVGLVLGVLAARRYWRNGRDSNPR